MGRHGIYGGSGNGVRTVKWVLRFDTSARGDNINIEPQFRGGSMAFAIVFGKTNGGEHIPPASFIISSLPKNNFGYTMV